MPCPIDCVFEDWSSWSVCDESCGPGTKERSRGYAQHPMYGGLPCEGEELESESCEVTPCPVDCEVRCGDAGWGTAPLSGRVTLQVLAGVVKCFGC